jgi:hypothetical protein
MSDIDVRAVTSPLPPAEGMGEDGAGPIPKPNVDPPDPLVTKRPGPGDEDRFSITPGIGVDPPGAKVDDDDDGGCGG